MRGAAKPDVPVSKKTKKSNLVKQFAFKELLPLSENLAGEDDDADRARREHETVALMLPLMGAAGSPYRAQKLSFRPN